LLTVTAAPALGLVLPSAATPVPPFKALTWSTMMSPNMFVVTICSGVVHDASRRGHRIVGARRGVAVGAGWTR
jgi:hypothetical protein